MSPRAFTVLRPPRPDRYARKIIVGDGEIRPADTLRTLLHETVSFCDLEDLAVKLTALQRENAFVIRGAPACPDQPLHRRLAHQAGRGTNGFEPVLRAWLALDIDGAKLPPGSDWRTDPDEAVDAVVARLPPPFDETSYFWAFTSSHGLAIESSSRRKRWTGLYTEDTLHVRIWFVLDRPISDGAARSWLALLQQHLPEVDPSIGGTVQPIYVARPLWFGHDGQDPLGSVRTSGVVRRDVDELHVPDELGTLLVRARAEGHGVFIPHAASAEAAVLSIGSPAAGVAAGQRGALRVWLWSAARQILAANPRPRHVALDAYAAAVEQRVAELVRHHEAAVAANVAQHGRSLAEVYGYLNGNIAEVARWEIERSESPAAYAGDGGGRRKRVSFVEQGSVFPVETVPVDEARRIATATLQAFRERARAVWPDREREAVPFAATLAVGTGAGKSRAIRIAAAELLRDLRAAGRQHTVAIAVPRHDLGGQQRAEFDAMPLAQELGLRSATWRGREATDPTTGDRMCVRFEDCQMLQRAGLSSDALCRRRNGETEILCPHHATCAYQAQRAQRADIWFVAHPMLFTEAPAALGTIGAVFIDEWPLNAALFGTEQPVDVAIGDLMADYTIAGDDVATGELRELRMRLQACLAAADGYLHRDHVARWFSGPGAMRAAIGLEWRRKVDPGIRPDMSSNEIEARLRDASPNAAIPILSRIWKTLAELRDPEGQVEQSGRLELHGDGPGKKLRITGVRSIGKGWAAPTIIADATLDADLLKPVWPTIEHSPRYPVAAPYVTVHQVLDRDLAKGVFAVEDATTDEERRRRGGNVREMYMRLLRHSLRYGGEPVLAILQKAVVAEIRSAGYVIPPWLHLAHQGGVAGRDDWREVRAVYVVGRLLPPSNSLARTAGALTGRAVRDFGYIDPSVQVALAAGGSAFVTAQRHPDEIADRLRWQVTEAGLLQAIGRGRGVNRTAATPLDIHLWTAVPLPELGPVVPTLWDELDVGADELMLVTGGVVLTTDAHALVAYPMLFSSASALKMQRARERQKVTTPYREYTIGECDLLVRTRYRLDRERSGSAEALCLPHLAAGLRAWLEQRLGLLAEFSIPAPALYQKGKHL